MTPFPAPPFSDPVGPVLSVPTTPIGGTVGFSSLLLHTGVGILPYLAWSHGYPFDIYINPVPGGPLSPFITLTMPPNTGAFYFYVQPGTIAAPPVPFFATGTSSGGTTPLSMPILVSGFDGMSTGGATYIGFYSPDNVTPLTSITIFNLGFPMPTDFAIGEFGIAAIGKVPCLHPDTLVATPNGEKYIKDIKKNNIVMGRNGEDIKVLHNMSFLPKNKFVKIPKNSISLNIPSADLLIRRDHPILIDGKEVLPQEVPHNESAELEEAVPVWSLCTNKRTFVMMNNVPVATWSYKAFARKIKNDKSRPYKKQ